MNDHKNYNEAANMVNSTALKDVTDYQSVESEPILNDLINQSETESMVSQEQEDVNVNQTEVTETELAETEAIEVTEATEEAAAPVVSEAEEVVVEEKENVANEEEYNIYVVQVGDTLADICYKEYGNAKRSMEVAKFNGLTDTNQIHVGQELKMPK